MGHWTLADIPWERFDRRRLDPEIVRLVKAAALVEYNGGVYAEHLCRIFADDADFQASARCWGAEEIQHGRALARWAETADREFDFADAFRRFQQGFRVDFERGTSRRGSRSGEMIARCIVETGTSSYYAALRDATDEPVLKEVCRRIAADEVRHYRLFFRKLGHCLENEQIGFGRRLGIGLGRVVESADDELAYAYYAANETALPYDRRRCRRAFARRAFAIIRQPHVAGGVRMIGKAIGLAPNGRLSRVAARLAWVALRRRAAHLARQAA
jgi:rubrerythrin